MHFYSLEYVQLRSLALCVGQEREIEQHIRKRLIHSIQQACLFESVVNSLKISHSDLVRVAFSLIIKKKKSFGNQDHNN